MIIKHRQFDLYDIHHVARIWIVGDTLHFILAGKAKPQSIPLADVNDIIDD